MKIEDINPGDPVVYIPHHLLVGDKSKMIRYENLGRVTSKNSEFVFVKYIGSGVSQATRPEDLYTIRNRSDLQKSLEDYEIELNQTKP